MALRITKHRLNEIRTKIIDAFIVPLLPRKYANLIQCSRTDLWNQYFVDAESQMQQQWEEIIWPLIKNFNFDVVLELAPGAGRNTERLCSIAKKVYAVDYNAYALDQCRQKLNSLCPDCDIEYFVNDGSDLNMIKDNSITAIYCWDAAVHFDKSILQNYIREFSRVLKLNGKGFIHHSNLGENANKNIKKNPGWRSNVSKDSFAKMCELNGLSVKTQIDIPWKKDNIVDCGTIFEKR